MFKITREILDMLNEQNPLESKGNDILSIKTGIKETEEFKITEEYLDFLIVKILGLRLAFDKDTKFFFKEYEHYFQHLHESVKDFNELNK